MVSLIQLCKRQQKSMTFQGEKVNLGYLVTLSATDRLVILNQPRSPGKPASKMRQSPVVNRLIIELLVTCKPLASLVFNRKTCFNLLPIQQL